MTAALLAVLVVAKVVALAGHPVPRSLWTPIAFFWHDAAVTVLFAATARLLRRRPMLVLLLYAVAVGYVAFTIPVVRVLGTPLTVTMWRAAGGALSDSIVYYVTAPNLACIALVLIVALAAPMVTARLPVRAICAITVPMTLLGPAAASQVDTHGTERNAWTALAQSALPRVAAEAKGSTGEEWREPFGETGNPTDLSWLRGAAAGRNVVVISLESTAAQYLGLYGATPDIAPNLTALAQSAVVFDRAYTVYPESIKGLFAALCSRYPAFDRPAESLATVPCRSPATMLAQRGYKTALFHAGRFAYLGMHGVIRDRGYHLLADAGDIGGNRESSFGIDEPAVVDAMLRWIDARTAGERFFLTYLPVAGHHPYESSPSSANPFPGRNEFERYRNAIHDSDAALGRLVEGVRRRGLGRQTVWMIYGDHGEAFGQHDGNYGHTFQLFEENVRVPFLIALPGLVTGQVRSARQVSLLDMAPTLLDVVGIDPPADYRGRTALSGPEHLNLFFTDYSLGLLGLRDGRFKFVYEIESGRGRLFDLAADPNEKRNIAGEHTQIAAAYARRLNGWITSESSPVIATNLRPGSR